MSFFLAHSGQMMSSASVMKPLPTNDPRQDEQTKQSLCQWRPSKDMNLVPPIPNMLNTQKIHADPEFTSKYLPVMGLEHAVQRLEKSSPKQSAQ